MLRYPPNHIGYWGGKERWSPGEPLNARVLVARVFKCMSCKIRWFRYMEYRGGLCHVCRRTLYEGEPDELF